MSIVSSVSSGKKPSVRIPFITQIMESVNSTGSGNTIETVKKYFTITNLLMLPAIFILFYLGGLIWYEG
jgi:hypothetical protein